MVFITLIQALCQQSFGLTLPQNCVGPRGPEMRLGPGVVSVGQSGPSGVSVAGDPAFLLRPGGGRGFLIHLRLLIWVEPRKEVKSPTNPDGSQEPERISQHFPHLQTCRLWRI